MVQIFAFQDKKGENFFNVFTAKNPAVATRVVKELAQSPGSSIERNPEDYALFLLGNLDEETGKIIPMKEIVHIAEAEDYKIEKK